MKFCLLWPNFVKTVECSVYCRSLCLSMLKFSRISDIMLLAGVLIVWILMDARYHSQSDSCLFSTKVCRAVYLVLLNKPWLKFSIALQISFIALLLKYEMTMGLSKIISHSPCGAEKACFHEIWTMLIYY
jgi:hypothetical protein